MNFLRKTAVMSMMAVSAFVMLLASCNDEDKLKGDDGTPVVIADSLANAFAEQVAAMRMLSGETETGVSYAVLREAGDALVALTDETSFVSYPDDVEYYPVLARHTENGSAYWALLDKEGNAEPLKNDSEELIPMTQDVSLKLTKGGYVIVASGKEFDTVFTADDKIQAFACDFHTDAESRVYAVTFDFAEGDSRTYRSLGYNEIGFLLPYDLEGEYVTEFFVNHSATSSVVLDIPEGIAYTLDVTEGWTASGRKVEAATYVDLTAPAQSDSETSCVLKVVSQECGVVLAELPLVNEPFRSLFTSTSDAFVEPAAGLRKFVYGLSEFDSYDEDSVFALSEGIVAGTSEPSAGCAVAEESVKVSLAGLLGGELDPDKRYVLWAVPALYREGENAGYYVEEGSVCSYEFGAMVFDIELVEAKILDAQISVTANGVDAVYGGVIPKSDDALELVASRLRNSNFTPVAAADGEFAFSGLMTDYPAAGTAKNEILPATTYLVWGAPAFAGEYPYEVDDLTYIEVTTGAVAAGGSVELTLGEPVMGRDEMSVQVSAPGASMIYYAVLNSSTGNLYSGASVANVDKFSQIMSNSPVLETGSSITAAVDKLKPGTTYWIFATAVDADGKYGPVKCVSGKTEALVWDTSITLKVELLEKTAKKLEFKVTSTGGDLSDYVYWAGRATDPFWANSTHCGGSRTTAERYIALNPDDENIRKSMNVYGELASDGTITIDGLDMETEYVFIILEKGDVDYSHAAQMKVATLAADLGVIVREGTDTWAEAKKFLEDNIDWIEDAFEQGNGLLSSSYTFKIKCPENLTAYIMCGSENYFEGAGITKLEQQMIEIENYASRRYEVGSTPYIDGELANEPDYVKNGETYSGQLMNVTEFYVHGVPSSGFVTYFAKGSHGEGNCIYWENGRCEQYKIMQDKIARYKTLDPWMDRATNLFGLEGKEAETWAQALLEAYSVYYKDATPQIFENDGNGIVITNPYATGVDDKNTIPDRVIVMLKDLQGNYYEPMYIEVPNYFDK